MFHAVYDPAALDTYIGQLVLQVDGVLDRAALRKAMLSLLQRHANLRASFIYDGVQTPMQVIPRYVPEPWAELDLSDGEHGRQLLTEWLAADRVRRFDLTGRRCCAARWSQPDPTTTYSVLTWHHILLDGWSMPLLVRELQALYAARGVTSGLPPVTPYREYLAWLAGQIALRPIGRGRRHWSM